MYKESLFHLLHCSHGTFSHYSQLQYLIAALAYPRTSLPKPLPKFGQSILLFAGWRSIFTVFLLLAVIVAVWFWLRMPETLPSDKRRAFTFPEFWRGLKEVVTHRTSMTYTATAGMVFGAFLGYLSSAQQILQIQYGLGERFPLYFALLALSIGGASLFNARLVMRFGMH